MISGEYNPSKLIQTLFNFLDQFPAFALSVSHFGQYTFSKNGICGFFKDNRTTSLKSFL